MSPRTGAVSLVALGSPRLFPVHRGSKARVLAAFTDDDVVDERDSKEASSFSKSDSHVTVVGARRWVTARVVVCDENRSCPKADGWAEHFPWVNEALVDRSARHLGVPDDFVPGVEEERSEDLDGFVLEVGSENPRGVRRSSNLEADDVGVAWSCGRGWLELRDDTPERRRFKLPRLSLRKQNPLTHTVAVRAHGSSSVMVQGVEDARNDELRKCRGGTSTAERSRVLEQLASVRAVCTERCKRAQVSGNAGGARGLRAQRDDTWDGPQRARRASISMPGCE